MKYRLSIYVSPLIIAVFVYDISILLDIAGSINILDNAVIVPLFCLAAKIIIPAKSEYDFKYNYQISIFIISSSLILFIGIIFFVIYSLVP